MAVLQQFGKIDVLINNAGVLHIKPFLEITSDELTEMIDTNFMAVFQLTQRIVPEMLKQKSGTIVNIASLAGKYGFQGGSGYAATKFALRGFANRSCSSCVRMIFACFRFSLDR
ncbi:MAG: SDR family oxidoreductase [Calditrichia bacterium]